MTERRKALARQALGLPSLGGVSIQNYFLVGVEEENFDDWMTMVLSGEARIRPEWDHQAKLFTLTLEGVEAALDEGESMSRDLKTSLDYYRENGKPSRAYGGPK